MVQHCFPGFPNKLVNRGHSSPDKKLKVRLSTVKRLSQENTGNAALYPRFPRSSTLHVADHSNSQIRSIHRGSNLPAKVQKDDLDRLAVPAFPGSPSNPCEQPAFASSALPVLAMRNVDSDLSVLVQMEPSSSRNQVSQDHVFLESHQIDTLPQCGFGKYLGCFWKLAAEECKAFARNSNLGNPQQLRTCLCSAFSVVCLIGLLTSAFTAAISVNETRSPISRSRSTSIGDLTHCFQAVVDLLKFKLIDQQTPGL